MFCSICGSEVKDGMKFCTECGCPIVRKNTAEVQPANPTNNSGASFANKPLYTTPSAAPMNTVGAQPANPTNNGGASFANKPLYTAPAVNEQPKFSFQQGQGYQPLQSNTASQATPNMSYYPQTNNASAAEAQPTHRSRFAFLFICWIGAVFGLHLTWLGYHDKAASINAEYGLGQWLRHFFNPFFLIKVFLWDIVEVTSVLFGKYRTDAHGVPVTYFRPKN